MSLWSQQKEKHVTHFFRGVGAGKCHQWPESNAKAHDNLPVVPVTQVSKEGSQEHVATDKNWKETHMQMSSGMNFTIFLKPDLHKI